MIESWKSLSYSDNGIYNLLPYLLGVVSSIGSVSTSSIQGSDSGFGPSSSSGPGGTVLPISYGGDMTEIVPTTSIYGSYPSGGASGLSTGEGEGLKMGPDGKPDLSHLTASERAIIENVMHRQQSEESKEVEFLR